MEPLSRHKNTTPFSLIHVEPLSRHKNTYPALFCSTYVLSSLPPQKSTPPESAARRSPPHFIPTSFCRHVQQYLDMIDANAIASSQQRWQIAILHNGLLLRSHIGILRRECFIPRTPCQSIVSQSVPVISNNNLSLCQRFSKYYYLFSNFLYPCLATIEDQLTTTTSPHDDAIRVAGACLLAITVSSLGILVQLLLCNQQYDSIDKVTSDNFFLRTLFSIQGEQRAI